MCDCVINRLSTLMGGEFTSNAVDRGLIDGWIKPKSLKLIFVTSPLKTQYE
jgi:hypothetical protein